MTAWFFENMAWASVMILAVLALRRPAAALFGAGPAYALWLLPALRLVMPPLPSLGADLPSLAPPLALIVPAPDAAARAAAPGLDWPSLLIAAWAAGAAAFLVWQWLAYRSFLTRLSLSSRSAGIHGGLPLVASGAVDGPVAVGLLDRRIVVPADFDRRYSAEERRLALEHERIHHRRGDIWCNLAALLVLALNWFNPLAWIAFRAYRADQEIACDAAVAAAAAPAERRDYAHALVKSASRTGLVAACPLNHADQLKRRLKMMNAHRSSRLRTVAGGGALLILAGLGAGLGAPGLAHPHPEGEGEAKQHRVMIIETKAGEGEGRAHNFTLRRSEGGQIVIPEGCRDGSGEVANLDEEGDRRTRFILCARGDATPAQRLEMLENARRRLAENEHLSAEQRSRITARLDEEIARMRAAR